MANCCGPAPSCSYKLNCCSNSLYPPGRSSPTGRRISCIEWLEFAGQTLDFVGSHPGAWMTASIPKIGSSQPRAFGRACSRDKGSHLKPGLSALRTASIAGTSIKPWSFAMRKEKSSNLSVRRPTSTTRSGPNRLCARPRGAGPREPDRDNGQLSASIAHEVNQPIAALLTNAETAVRWLARQPPNLEKAKPLIDRVISDGKRTADIVSRL